MHSKQWDSSVSSQDDHYRDACLSLYTDTGMIEDLAESVFELRSTTLCWCVYTAHVRPLVLSNKVPVYSSVVSSVNTHREIEKPIELGFVKST